MALMPGAIQVGPIPASNFATGGTPKIGEVTHVIVGSATSALGEFQGQGAELSAHFIVAGPNDGWPDGTILQVLDTDLCAYAQEAGNYVPTCYIAIEYAGDVTFAMSDAQMAAGAKIKAWAAQTHGFPLVGPVAHGQPGCTTHCNPDGSPDPNWGDHPCPGPIRLAQIPKMIAMAVALTTPPLTPTEAFMPVSPAVFFAGQNHVLQVSGGALWHKWWGPTGPQGNENVFTAAGLGQVTLPVQAPATSIVNSQLTVVVEDGNGKAWYFGQSAGGPWGAKELS